MKENVIGLQKLIDTLEKIPEELDDDVSDVLFKNANQISSQAKIYVPKDTGFLSNSIGVHPVEKKTFDIKATAVYANYIEFGEPIGTGPHGGPKPFLFPAFFQQRPKLIEDLEKVLKDNFE